MALTLPGITSHIFEQLLRQSFPHILKEAEGYDTSQRDEWAMSSQLSRCDEGYLAGEQAVKDLPTFTRRTAAKSNERETYASCIQSQSLIAGVNRQQHSLRPWEKRNSANQNDQV